VFEPENNLVLVIDSKGYAVITGVLSSLSVYVLVGVGLYILPASGRCRMFNTYLSDTGRYYMCWIHITDEIKAAVRIEDGCSS
jgi:hypothetical protein